MKMKERLAALIPIILASLVWFAIGYLVGSKPAPHVHGYGLWSLPCPPNHGLGWYQIKTCTNCGFAELHEMKEEK